jgi:uncharacterized protein YfiM (DUF2279 family)
MKKLFVISLAACALFVFMAEHAHAHDDGPRIPPPSPASQATGDNWGGAPAHVAVSALAGLACSAQLYPHQKLKAFGCAMTPGVIKEVIDSAQKGNRFSVKDIIADAVGAGLGVYVGGLMLDYNERTKTTTVSISIPLQ